jgi:hypothetical protein
MSVFQLPKTLCQELNSLMCHFFGVRMTHGNKVVWLSWAKMGKSKMQGGMGFRELEYFNLAMLAKQGWRLITNPDSMVAKILKEKYYPQHSFLEAPLGNRPSFAWRSICNSRALLKEGLMWRVGNGESIQIWHDKWLPSPTSYVIQSLFPSSETS